LAAGSTVGCVSKPTEGATMYRFVFLVSLVSIVAALLPLAALAGGGDIGGI
jgi:uncharacterized membrane protein